MKKIAIFGTSGFASEVADICDTLGYNQILYLASPLDKMIGSVINGVEVRCESIALNLSNDGFGFAIGIASGRVRNRIFNLYPNLFYPNLAHPSATFGRLQEMSLQSSKGIVIAAGCRFMSNIQVGNFSVFGLNSTIGHDCDIGDYVSVMPNVSVSGNVSINDAVFIGSGAVILQGAPEKKLRLCQSLVVGAGAVVTKTIEHGQVIVGMPAKVIR